MNLNDAHSIVRLILKKCQNEIQNFIIGSFHFELLKVLNDSCVYRVRLGNFGANMFFLGVGADSRCDYCLNVDFVHFIWDNFERFSIRKFGIIILSSDNVPAPLNLSVALPSSTRLLYLKYYRAFSDSLWMNRQICGECIIKNRLSLKFLCGCPRPEGV